MDFFRRFTFLFCAPAFDAEALEGHRLNEITIAIERLGFQVIRARRIEDAEMAVQTDAAIGCMIVDWGKKGLEGKTADRGLEMPIVMLVRRKRLEDIPVEVLDYIDGYIFLAEETPEFIAKNLVSRLKPLCDYILFDEAWAGFMKFHPLYAGRFAMGLGDLGPERPGIIATQSTHKQLPASARPRRSTSRTAISKASAGGSSIAGSTSSSCCMPRRRRSIRCSPRSTSARR
jgi:hypothetical protein